MGGRITTHALDLSRGRPAAGLAAELWAEAAPAEGVSTWSRIASVRLNPDGRADGPLAEGDLKPGAYELRFDVGGYFGSSATGFLGIVPVRFHVTDTDSHYHIPLLVSPGGYSTYRGS